MSTAATSVKVPSQRPRYTNRYIGWRGDTVLISVRVPAPVAETLREAVGREGLPTLSAVVQDAVAFWAMAEQEQEHA